MNQEEQLREMQLQLAALLEWKKSVSVEISGGIEVIKRIEASVSGNSLSGNSESLVSTCRANKDAIAALTASVDSRFKELDPIKRLWWGISAIATLGGAGAVWHIINFLAQSK
jgi:hypothetical protein